MQAKIKKLELPMAPSKPPLGYSLSQILLHWVIALLIMYQLIFGEGIEHAYHALNKGKEANPADLTSANIHLYIGIAIFVLAILRLIVRAKNGVPPAPPRTTGPKKWIAAATQHTLYLVIILMPITGGIAWFVGLATVGDIHTFGKPLILFLVLLHVAGALLQHFIAKTDVLVRIFVPVRSS
jgi:cytochrome b561